ncbi:MAG TPA: ATP-binding protein [Thermoguttaceae bacterium]|nr:ATP-binding protein [Thermoguttaceae bacterium]
MSGFSSEQYSRLIEELHSYQAELETQNRQLLASDANYREIFNAVNDALLVHDGTTGKVLDVNAAACAMYGVTPDEARGMDVMDLTSGEPGYTQDVVNRRIAEIADVGTAVFEWRAKRKSGEPFWVEVSLRRTTIGGRDRVLAVVRDITERRLAEEALRRARDELESRVTQRTEELTAVNARLREEVAERKTSERRRRQLEADLAHVGRLTTMDEMAGSLAHELNQPLGAIVLHAEVLAAKMRNACSSAIAPELIESATAIAKQAHRAGELVRRMRQFAKHATPKRAPLAPSEAVAEVVSLMGNDLRDAGIALVVDADSSLPVVSADKILLQQVLLNLMRNAVEAMTATPRNARWLDVQAKVDGDSLIVAVRDTGCGIPVEKAGRPDELFGAFFSTKSDGLGMGLAISRSIVESHGGRIWATPNPDQGTTFTFTVPFAAEDREHESNTDGPRR